MKLHFPKTLVTYFQVSKSYTQLSVKYKKTSDKFQKRCLKFSSQKPQIVNSVFWWVVFINKTGEQVQETKRRIYR